MLLKKINVDFCQKLIKYFRIKKNKITYTLLGESMSYYFIGIKGSGMSSLAMLVKDKGYDVIGSDVDEYIFTEVELKKKGIKILNFNKDNFNREDIVVIGHKFINSDNEEVLKAKRENEWYEYNDFLSNFIKKYYSIAVSGSHGKTTTTSLIMHVLSEIDECGYLIGDGTSHISELSHYFVFEACEQKEHFLKYHSDVVLINNIDYDHVDYFKTEEDYIKAFYKFSKLAKKKLIVNGDDYCLNQFEDALKFGIGNNNDVIARDILEDERGISYDLYYFNKILKRIELPFYGHHMIYNSLGAISVGLYLGLNIDIIEKGIKRFKGVKRRFNEVVKEDCIYIDDYAHHPSEIRATIKACRQKYPNKQIIAFFKGDRYSRIYKFASEIASSLELADMCYVLPFPSSSTPEEGININETYLKLFSSKINLLDENEYLKLASMSDCIYLFMSSKNMLDIQNKIIELKQKKV